METLVFSPLGQWTLLEKNAENDRPLDDDYLSYRSLKVQGQLPVDHGTKGQLHGVPSRSQKQTSDNKMKAKVPTPNSSQFADKNPGLEERTKKS